MMRKLTHVVLGLLVAGPAHAQVASFDVKRCQSGDYRQLDEAQVAFCDGYESGEGACVVWSGTRKQSSDACLAGALVRSQQRIRVERTPPPDRGTRTADARLQDRPPAALCSRTLVDAIGVARLEDVRPVVIARFAQIVVGTVPGSTSMRLDARRSACDDARLSAVFYDFDAAGVLRDVTFAWERAPGPAPAPIFSERARALAKLYPLAPAQSPSRLEARSAKTKIVVEDAPERGMLLETYSSAN